MTVLLGTQFYAGPADAMRRQEQAIGALLGLHGVALVNLQWIDEAYERTEIETLRVLRRDSRTVTRLSVRRKPIMPELFDALAGVAAKRGCQYFGFLNADILVSQAAVDVIAREQRDAYGFSRRDGGEPPVRTRRPQLARASSSTVDTSSAGSIGFATCTW